MKISVAKFQFVSYRSLLKESDQCESFKISLGSVSSFTSLVGSFETFYDNQLRKVVRNWKKER